jgi:hypothetical protein
MVAFGPDQGGSDKFEEASRGGANVNSKTVAPFKLIGRDYHEQHEGIART